MAPTDRLRPHRTRHTPTRAARAILFALGTITLGGSSVFVYSAAIGKDLDGLSPLTVSLLFSGNALGSHTVGAMDRTPRPRRASGFSPPPCARLAIAASRSGVVFGAAIVGWGFVFFMGVPAAFNLLAERSNFPEERAGDAQAMMALGRVFGPIMGGTLLAAGSEVTLGFVSARSHVVRRLAAAVRRPASDSWSCANTARGRRRGRQSTRRSTRSEPVADTNWKRPDSSAGRKICSYGGRPPSAGSGNTSWIASVPPTATCGVQPS